MSSMNVSLPESLRKFVEQQVDRRGFGTSSEYVRELIRRDQDHQTLRAQLIEGARSRLDRKPIDKAYFDGLRKKLGGKKPKR